ncbi:autotransporter [Mesorhizobium sp. B2-3-12]|uniref:autotransporter n=1 Tax=Mesorhizobium sp. B2-3-12 TaxID=2589952 RepID=UPI00112DB2C2|nr:autotransporter [Mesorhizobium sp. B2-3-12]TPL88511.1 autotransporter [Mesorhizobium sp. B2-3-12]
MRVPRRVYQLGSVPLLALAAASTFQMSGAAACSATAEGTSATVGSGVSAVTTFQTTSVTVACSTTGTVQDVDGVFTTGFEGYKGQDNSSSTVIVNDYDGNGDDVVNIVGGMLNDSTPPPSVTGLPPINSEVTTSLQPGAGTIQLLGGNDRFDLSDGVLNGELFAPQIDANLDTGAGDDSVVIHSGSILSIYLGEGSNSLKLTAGEVDGSVIGGDGIDTITIGNDTSAADGDGGIVAGSVLTNGGADTLSIKNGAMVYGDSEGGAAIGLGDGDDHFTMTGGVLDAGLSGGDGNDTLDISGGSVHSPVTGDSGDDRITITGGMLAGKVIGDAGDDVIVISGGTIGSTVSGDDGNDTITVSGGTIDGNVSGGAGFDQVSVSGGTIKGGIDADHVQLSGGTISGDITGLGPNTLIINGSGAVDPLNLSDHVLFSGTNANGTVTDTDLAAGGKSQNFAGFNGFSADHSTLRFSGGTQGINQLNLGNGSTLFINGNVAMPGSIIATNSLINMTDGAADDVLTLGGLTLNGASIGLDINQQTLQSDQLVANAFSATGVNTIIVNLLGTPQFAQATDIPIIVSTSGPIAGIFNIQGTPGTLGSLFTYAIVAGPNGGLFLRATPANFGIAAAPTSATNAGAVTVAIDALYGINRDAIDADLPLSPASGSGMVPVSSSFGVFASGQFAHTEHDGYNISGVGMYGPGPSFDADDFSAAISLDFNAAKHFQFDNEYGLNIGVFAGYASTDVKLGGLGGFDALGEGTNKAGMFGGYALLRKDYNYALVSASGFFGGSEVANGVLGTTGSYDTEGYAVTGSVGHIFTLGERTRFDLRGGLLGVSFRGDPFTDSGGNQFGKSRLSFGAFKVEPGIYGDYKLSNGMIFSPYARAELQQRFGYKNTTEIDTRTISFDDADFSAALSAGFNLKVSELTTVNGEVRGKVSSDSSTIGAKLGLKVAF